VAAKSRQFTTDETGKGKFFRENRRNLAGKGVVRKKFGISVSMANRISASGQIVVENLKILVSFSKKISVSLQFK